MQCAGHSEGHWDEGLRFPASLMPSMELVMLPRKGWDPLANAFNN